MSIYSISELRIASDASIRSSREQVAAAAPNARDHVSGDSAGLRQATPAGLMSLPSDLLIETANRMPLADRLALRATDRALRQLVTRRGVSAIHIQRAADLAEAVRAFPHARSLDVHSSCNALDDEQVAHLARLKNLSRLVFNGFGQISDAGLARLKGLPLQELTLDGGDITDTGLAHLAKLPLRRFQLSATTRITDAGLAHLAGMPLQELGLCVTPITGKGFRHFKGLPLRRLDLSATDVKDAELAQLKGLPISKLDLSATEVTDAGLANLKGLPLQKLSVGRNITNAGLRHLTGMPLRTLDITDAQVTNAGIESLKYMPLRSLHLSRTHVTDGMFAHLRDMPLEELSLGFDGCAQENPHGITNAGLAQLDGLPLQKLCLNSCKHVTDEGLACLKGMPLKELELWCMQAMNITDGAIAHFEGLLLRKLLLVESNISRAGQERLKAMLPDCSITVL